MRNHQTNSQVVNPPLTAVTSEPGTSHRLLQQHVSCLTLLGLMHKLFHGHKNNPPNSMYLCPTYVMQLNSGPAEGALHTHNTDSTQALKAICSSQTDSQ